MAESDGKWQKVMGSDRKWEEVVGNGRKWQGVAGSGRKWQEVAGSGRTEPGAQRRSSSLGLQGAMESKGSEKQHRQGASHLVVAPHRVAEGLIGQHLSLSVQEGQEALLHHHQLLLVDLREQKNQRGNQGRSQGRRQWRRQDRREAEDKVED